GRLDRAVPAVQGRRDDRDRDLAPVASLHDALGLRAAFAGGERFAEPAHHGGVGREDLLDEAPLGAPRRALGEHLGRGVPQDRAKLSTTRDRGRGTPRTARLEVHWGGVREAGLFRGWPDPDATCPRPARPPRTPASPLPLLTASARSARIARSYAVPVSSG